MWTICAAPVESSQAVDLLRGHFAQLTVRYFRRETTEQEIDETLDEFPTSSDGDCCWTEPVLAARLGVRKKQSESWPERRRAPPIRHERDRRLERRPRVVEPLRPFVD